MRRDTWVQIGAVAVMGVCLAASGVLTTQIAASAGRNRLVYADSAEKGDPPEVAAGIAMGAFRGLFVNVLWIRANNLKEEGKYYEAVDLANMITKLQPRFPRVWVFHAWNLAYNISVTTGTPQERWQWVQAGIRLLRDRGIPANPTDLLLHKELAWFYLHKVQGIMDDANWYYKRQLASEWAILLGPPPRRTKECSTPKQMTEAYVEWLSRINDAKDTIGELEADVPGASGLVERFRAEAGLDLTGKLWDDAGHGPGERLLQFIEAQRAVGSMQSAMPGVALRGTRGMDPHLVAIYNDAGQDKDLMQALRALVLHVRKRLLIDKEHMEPDRMIRYTRDAGPLDWRHPAAHAYYWATRGVDESQFRITAANRHDFDILNTDRVAIQAVQELYRSGELYFDPFNPTLYVQLPDPDFIDSYSDILEKLADRSMFVSDKGEIVTPDKGRPFSLYQAGYENFLKDAIRFLYRRGEKDRAEVYRQKMLSSRLNTNRDPADYVNHLTDRIENFVNDEIVKEDRFSSPYVAASEVSAALESAYLSGLLTGNMPLYRAQMEYAQAFHKKFTEKQVFNVTVNRGDTGRMEVMDKDFNAFAGKVLATMILLSGIPDGAVIYDRAPSELKVQAYPLLAQSPLNVARPAGESAPGAAAAPSEFEIWFPAPAGWENYLKELAAKRAAQDKARGKVEQK